MPNFVGLTTMLDCPDPIALAKFYALLTESEIAGVHEVDGEPHWVVIGSNDKAILAFQHVKNYKSPTWPEGPVPMQTHLDIDVKDLDAAEALVLSNGATKPEFQPGGTKPNAYRVFLDPVGHPFCLCYAG